MNDFWKNFKRDKYFFRNYLLLQAIIISFLAIIFNYLNIGNLISFEQAPWYLVPLALIIGIKLPTIMHNAVHRNFSKFNFIIGELSSQIILVAFGTVCINHTFHHAWPDSKKDPHSPIGKSFYLYLITCLHSGVDVIKEGFLQAHGEDRKTNSLFKQCIWLHFGLIPVRLFFWYSLLGQTLFLFFFLPAFLIFLLTFAHVNYITHTTDHSGKVIVVNKDSNIWYRFVNIVADGIYFHKNHHLNPGLYNPSRIKVEK